MASRHLSRMNAVQALFAADMRGDLSLERVEQALEANTASFKKGEEDPAFTDSLVRGVVAKRPEIDALIAKAAPDWPIERIAPIDRTVLRVGLFELLYGAKDVPPKVAMDEAIELGKTFGGDASGAFVNGVLGGVYRDIEAHG